MIGNPCATYVQSEKQQAEIMESWMGTDRQERRDVIPPVQPKVEVPDAGKSDHEPRGLASLLQAARPFAGPKSLDSGSADRLRESDAVVVTEDLEGLKEELGVARGTVTQAEVRF